MKNFVLDPNYRTIENIPNKNYALTFLNLEGYKLTKGKREGWFNKRPVVKVKCLCGCEFLTMLDYYKNGKSQSCGCFLRKDLAQVKKLKRTFTRAENKKWSAYLNRAKSKKFEFEFTKEEFVTLINQPCFYCGIDKLNGIDRIDSNIGYLKHNCRPCCGDCNIAKHTMSHDQFINFIKRVYKHINKRELQRL